MKTSCATARARSPITLLPGISERGRSLRRLLLIILACVFALASRYSAGAGLSPRQMAVAFKSNASAISTNSSYAYKYFGTSEKSKQCEALRDLFRRKGDKFIHIRDWSDYHPDAQNLEKNWNHRLHVNAFDGQKSRLNSLDRGFSYMLLPDVPKDSELFTNLNFYDRMLENDKKNSRSVAKSDLHGKPTGIIADGLRRSRPGDILSDWYLQGALSIPRMYPPVYYGDLLEKENAHIVAEDGTKVTVRAFFADSVDSVMQAMPNLSREEALRHYNRWECEMVVDTSRGCMVLEARLWDNQKGIVDKEVRDVSVAQDTETGVWYPTGYTQKSNTDGREYKVELLAMSFAPVGDEVFSDVWLNEQWVTDETKGETYVYLLNDPASYHEDKYLEPNILRHEDRLRYLAAQMTTDLTGSLETASRQPGAAIPTPPVAKAKSAPKVPQSKDLALGWLILCLTCVGVFLVWISLYLRRRPRRDA